MNSMTINFAPRTVARIVYQIRPLTWLLVFLAIIFLCVGAWNIEAQLHLIESQDATLQRLNARVTARVNNKPAVKAVTISDAQAAAVNSAIAQLNLPWRDLFDALEAATPKTIALLAMEPDAKRDTIRCLAEAKSSDDMIAYIEQLKKQTLFTSVLLDKEEINEQDVNKPLRFQFEAHWNGDKNEVH